MQIIKQFITGIKRISVTNLRKKVENKRGWYFLEHDVE